MPQQEVDIWLLGGISLFVLASFATWAYLFARWERRGVILAYEPRTPVPWGGWAGVLAVVMTALAIVVAATGGGDSGAAEAPPDEFADVFQLVEQLMSMIVFQTIVTGSFLAVVILTAGAKQRDLGLPLYAEEAARDVGIGVVACLAAFVPVWAVQMIVVLVQKKQDEISEHPLIQMVERQPSFAVMLLAFVVAVIVAPITEEITYRMLLQGWLEKWEDWRLGWRGVAQPQQYGEVSEGAVTEKREEGVWTAEQAAAAPEETMIGAPMEATAGGDDSASLGTAEIEPSAPELPPRRGVFGLPYGWTPILISALLFSAAHVGAGYDPIPLFPLALILGYVYQRTHRIIPCIVTHLVFNLTSMVALWRMISTEAD